MTLIANEVIDALLRRKPSGVVCKLDIEKAYDHLHWDFLMKLMSKMSFGSKWTNWINWCIFLATFFVMVNGSPFGFFRSSRGLRQGDPLSPYLFVLGMEALSYLIAKAVEGGFISDCRFGGSGREEMVISHLLYADNIILFCEPKKDHIAYLSCLLMWLKLSWD